VHHITEVAVLWPTALTLQVASRAPVETATQEMDTTVAVSQHVVEVDKLKVVCATHANSW